MDSNDSERRSNDGWLKLAKTDDDLEWLKQVTRNGQIALSELPDWLDSAGLERLLELLGGDPPPLKSSPVDRYQKKRESSARREKAIAEVGRELGPLPPIRDPERRTHCRRNLRAWCELYFPKHFPLAFSPDHLRVIAKIQTAVLVGMTQAVAMPRGNGKTTLCRDAVLWSAFYGHHLFQMLLNANADQAATTISILKLLIETNPRLLDDFPEVVFPIRALERIAQRANGQRYEGKPTYLNWSGDEIVFPVIPGAAASGAVIVVAGLQEAVRGANRYHVPTEQIIRPTLILIDDPSTKNSAKSQEENNTRESIIKADLMGLPGPGEQLSVLMPCTVICPDDVASRFLDRSRSPEWRGETCQMLYDFPARMELWEQYATIVRQCLAEHDDESYDDGGESGLGEILSPATHFYRSHYEEMREGARVAWPERHQKWEIDGLQHSMNLYFRDPVSFWAEYQNDPIKALEADDDQLNASTLAGRVSGYDHLQVPEWAQYIVAHIDCHKRLLYYTIAAVSPGFDGAVIHYGTYPKQSAHYFTERTARPTLESMHPGAGVEGALKAGLLALAAELFSRPYLRTDGAELRMRIALADARWKTDTVFSACQEFASRGDLVPAMGRIIGPDQTPLSACKPKVGEHIGQEWTIPPVHGRSVRHVQVDTNRWKTFLARRLLCPPEAAGAWRLFGTLNQAGSPSHDHRFYSQHLASQFSKTETGTKRTVELWDLKPGQTQDHFFDTLVGCAVAASVVGAQFLHTPRAGRGGKRTFRQL